ncbi:MAG: prepilin-type N-terminal cleavage/methylation domain-containing protein [Opitutaceae bacterium]|nr:prepilin-type N-terminal cleavage/methylation domain-containing protein [Opitutaceae bacterium]
MMPTQPRPARGPATRRRTGFSLVEMIGVLAIIAILAVVIVPKVFSTIASSRVTAAIASVNTMKTAVIDFAGRFGTIPTTTTNSRLDDLLFTAGITEGRFSVKIGTQPGAFIEGASWAKDAATGVWTPGGAVAGNSQAGQSRVICVNSNATAPSAANGANYRLNGAVDLPARSRVVSAVIVNVTATDALDMSRRLDGDTYSEQTAATADNAGKVVYRAPNGQGLTNVYVYLTHQ